MNKLVIPSLFISLLGLSGCDQAPSQASKSQANVTAANEKPLPEQAIAAALSSPETAARLAVSSPEATAMAAARAAEQVASKAAAAPESSLVKVTAYAKLAAVAAAAAPGSTAARDAAKQAESQRKLVEGLVKPATTK